MKKVLIVFGTRPEAIKMAPLYLEFQKYKNYFDTKLCVTAQHRYMLDQVLDIFDIKADFDLDIMKKDQDLFDVTTNILQNIKTILDDFSPEYVFVHGDTTTTFATSLACFYSKIKVCHVEAGLRTYDIYSPYPEEANRQLTSIMTYFHFAPTVKSKINLINENVDEKKILVTGNSVIDALMIALKKASDIKSNFTDGRYILVTGHRRENFGQGFLDICEALKEIAQKNRDISIVYPVHLNPNVQKPVNQILAGIENIYLIEPQEYLEFVALMRDAYFIITDSGGIQEEAPSLGKPVLVTRDTTERPEAIEAGTVKLVGTKKKIIVKEAQLLLDNKDKYMLMSKAHNPYGDGNSCEKIVQFLRENV